VEGALEGAEGMLPLLLWWPLLLLESPPLPPPLVPPPPVVLAPLPLARRPRLLELPAVPVPVPVPVLTVLLFIPEEFSAALDIRPLLSLKEEFRTTEFYTNIVKKEKM
jgi:hypothetical protein